MAQSPFSLEQIYNFDEQYITEFLTLNGADIDYNPLTNKLATTILMHNGALLQPAEQRYVTEVFKYLYVLTDQQLRIISADMGASPKAGESRIEIIKHTINMFNIMHPHQAYLKEYLIIYGQDNHVDTVRFLLKNGAVRNRRFQRSILTHY